MRVNDLGRRATVGIALAGLVTAGLLAAPAQAAPGEVVVTTTADSGAGSLREALDQAAASPEDDRVIFAPSVTGSIVLTSGQLLAEVGGGAGSLTIEGPGAQVLTVDAGERSRVLDIVGPGGDTRPSVDVHGLTLTRGHPGFSEDSGVGGALRADGVDLSLDSMVVTDSSAERDGGGVQVVGGSLLVADSTIARNSTTSGDLFNGRGGGIYFDGGAAAGAAVTIDDSTVADNTAGALGGGVFSVGRAPVTVTDSTVRGNTAWSQVSFTAGTGIIGDGGGISAGDLTVTDSTITGNEAGSVGGGLVAETIDVIGSTFDGNVARGGGGIAASGSDPDDRLRLESSTVTGNRADVGGGISSSFYVHVQMARSTVAANAAVTGGGLAAAGEVTLQGTIIAMNSGGDLAGPGSATLERSLVRDPRDFTYVDSGGAIIGEDPLLGRLADHGGPTDTLVPAPNSPAIDQGSAFGSATDQRSRPTPVDDAGTPDAADGSDIGSVELSEAELLGRPQVGNTVPPTVTGSVRVGETVQADVGTWTPVPGSVGYQWLRDGTPITGATSASYTLTGGDFGGNRHGTDYRKRISVSITADIAGHREGSMVSDFTDHVAPGSLRVLRRALVTGVPRVGAVLRARPRLRMISPRPFDVSIRWFLDGRPLSRAFDRRRLELKPWMRGEQVSASFSYQPPTGYQRLVQVADARRPVT